MKTFDRLYIACALALVLLTLILLAATQPQAQAARPTIDAREEMGRVLFELQLTAQAGE
jgi:Tfp pilus assembly protein PilV